MNPIRFPRRASAEQWLQAQGYERDETEGDNVWRLDMKFATVNIPRGYRMPIAVVRFY